MSTVRSDTLPRGEVVVYEADNGEVRLDVRLDQDTVWLTQRQMADLFGRDRSVVTQHIRNAFLECELDPKTTNESRRQLVHNVHRFSLRAADPFRETSTITTST